MSNITVCIAYTSGYGHTLEIAKAVARGAASVSDTTVNMIDVARIAEDDWHALADCDAIIFGSPTYMGSASSAFHVFAEATSGPWMARAWENKIAAGFTNSGSMSGDKLHTLQYFSILAAQHGMVWVSLGLLPGWNVTTGSEFDQNRLGFYLGAGAQTWNDQGSEAVHDADVATATHLGQRVALHAKRFREVVPATQ